MKKTSEYQPPVTSVSFWLKKNYRIIWWLLFVLSAVPAVHLYYLYSVEQLGINPLETMTRSTGRWSLIFLIITLTMTPLRRLTSWFSQRINAAYGKRVSDWNWLIMLRRMTGLYCFFYASVHLWIFLQFDLMWDWEFLQEDLQEKQYILFGFMAYLITLLLALTSFNRVIRWMGRRWKTLHRSVYLVSIMVLVHFWMLVKVGVYTPLPYTIMIALLLLYRIVAYYGLFFRKPKDLGEIVEER